MYKSLYHTARASIPYFHSCPTIYQCRLLFWLCYQIYCLLLKALLPTSVGLYMLDPLHNSRGCFPLNSVLKHSYPYFNYHLFYCQNYFVLLLLVFITFYFILGQIQLHLCVFVAKCSGLYLRLDLHLCPLVG